MSSIDLSICFYLAYSSLIWKGDPSRTSRTAGMFLLQNLKSSDNYTGCSCYDSKPLKFRDFVFQKNNGQCYGHYR